MTREHRSAEQAGQTDFENRGFENSSYGEDVNRGRNHSSQDWKRKEHSPNKQSGFGNSSFENSKFGGSSGRRNIQDRQRNRSAWDKSGGNRPQQNRSGGDNRSRNLVDDSRGINRQSFNSDFHSSQRNRNPRNGHRPRNRPYSISPERHLSVVNDGSARRSSYKRLENHPRRHQSSSFRDAPSFKDSHYRAHRTEHHNRSANVDRRHSFVDKKFYSSGFKRSVGSISHYYNGHDNRNYSPEQKHSRHVKVEPSDNPWLHDKFEPSTSEENKHVERKDISEKMKEEENDDIDENIPFEVEENY